MDLPAFLAASAGQWFAQRTLFFLAEGRLENYKSTLNTDWLPPTDPTLIAQCQQLGLNPDHLLGGWRSQWDTAGDWGAPKQTGSKQIALIADADRPTTGILLQAPHPSQLLQGRYAFGLDESLTLTLSDGAIAAEERLWFASENLRLRTSTVQYGGKLTTTAFYSEIRRVNV
ncbi:MAG: phycobiliprotein lyase [Chloroflexaceae bacterium]|nr:phycobiliprotein lyase [Chloroflexaceae bacterium]